MYGNPFSGQSSHSSEYSCVGLDYKTSWYWSWQKKFYLQGGPKTDTQFYFCDNFGNSAQILTILSLLQAAIHLA